MKRKILLACSMLIIVAVLSTGLLAGCGGTTTVTTTKTAPAQTVTSTVTTTRTNTVTQTASGATVTETVGAGETATVTATTTVTQTVGTGDGDGLITILNPDTQNHMVERVPLIERLDTLQGKSIYLMDVNWGSGDMSGAYSFLTLTAQWLEDEYNCTTKVVKKRGAYFFGDPDLFAEAAENADAVIFGISG
jgi:hypothetical protein